MNEMTKVITTKLSMSQDYQMFHFGKNAFFDKMDSRNDSGQLT